MKVSGKLVGYIGLLAVAFLFFWYENSLAPSSQLTLSPSPAERTNQVPIEKAQSRITKKTFGTYVTPNNSPVQPERFTGYHTGLDFEILPGEESKDIPIYAICEGPLQVKRFSSGYGGVVVQACSIDNQSVTVVYGHLRLTSIPATIGDTLKREEIVGVLGTGYSAETDNERKHLHLSIHRGTAIDLRGYVQRQSDLSQWIDPMGFLF